jgi:hypothetical protein
VVADGINPLHSSQGKSAMKTNSTISLLVLIASGSLASFVFADEAASKGAEHENASTQTVCTGFGPQTPRDIDNPVGENNPDDSFAPGYNKLNLCNIHFHNGAEHKAKAFSISAHADSHGHGGGFECGISKSLSAAELAAPAGDICGGLHAGDTVEVNWVYSSCNVAPGEGLGSCLTDTCKDPELRVETQVFTLVNDSSALDFNNFSNATDKVDGVYQARALPEGNGKPVQFLGSSTGPKYDSKTCSPLEASWSVRPQCAKLDINSIGKWCESNVFNEDHAHGVRALVTDPSLLSEIK